MGKREHCYLIWVSFRIKVDGKWIEQVRKPERFEGGEAMLAKRRRDHLLNHPEHPKDARDYTVDLRLHDPWARSNSADFDRPLDELASDTVGKHWARCIKKAGTMLEEDRKRSGHIPLFVGDEHYDDVLRKLVYK